MKHMPSFAKYFITECHQIKELLIGFGISKAITTFALLITFPFRMYLSRSFTLT